MPKSENSKAWDALQENIREAIVTNNLVALKPAERLQLYKAVCESKGLDPAARPFEFISLKGKLQMYARKECADQLRELHGISVEIVSQDSSSKIANIVHVRAKNSEGRTEDEIGAVAITEPEFLTREDGKTKYPNPRHGKTMEGIDYANAMMKSVTKAKRRVTFAICGLGMFDETEIEGIAESEKAKAPTLEEVKQIAAKVKALREQAAKSPKKDQAELIREACALEETILNLPGSGHTPEEPARAAGGSPEPSKTPEAPNTPKPAPEPVAKAAEKPAPAPAPVEEEEDNIPMGDEHEAAAKTGGWRDHIILKIPKPEFKGKPLGLVPEKTIRIIYENWVKKFADEISKHPEKKQDAEAITQAIAEIGAM